ncbi:hypothetical protein M3204_18300 [Mesobacillus subterraneus]|uniref:hypothetical protein n=1 Tax=Mesobacillus subterraneus TaxID=285983 RepID=UPI00203FA5FD|nr:hypothetical protein [Mesobacillus subterraneus]MCM3666374.1 hypothetical protein [Mesobacillus subterraneus]MCM3685354.1 hypothetical protein [Mesobacillus subterraneus]
MSKDKRSAIILSICSAIIQKKQGSQPLVVGITGIDTSGKSKLIKELADQLRRMDQDVQTIHVDNFHNPKSQRYNENLSEPDQYFQLSIDFNFLKQSLLEPIKQLGKIEIGIDHLDLESDTVSVHKHYRITPNTIILIEGVFLYRPETRPFIDFFIFLKINEETALQRAWIRDVPSQGEEVIGKYHTKYFPAQRRYLEEYRPDLVSDIVIDNSNLDNPQIVIWPESMPAEVANENK